MMIDNYIKNTVLNFDDINNLDLSKAFVVFQKGALMKEPNKLYNEEDSTLEVPVMLSGETLVTMRLRPRLAKQVSGVFGTSDTDLWTGQKVYLAVRTSGVKRFFVASKHPSGVSGFSSGGYA